MKIDKCDKNYVSATDQFLAEFDKTHPEKSASQLAEIKEYERIGRLRDKPHAATKPSKLWEGF